MNLATRALAGVFVCAVTSAAAQTYPTKTVRIIVPFAPAGPTDNQARWAAQQLTAPTGQTFIANTKRALAACRETSSR